MPMANRKATHVGLSLSRKSDSMTLCSTTKAKTAKASVVNHVCPGHDAAEIAEGPIISAAIASCKADKADGHRKLEIAAVSVRHAADPFRAHVRIERRPRAGIGEPTEARTQERMIADIGEFACQMAERPVNCVGSRTKSAIASQPQA